MAGLISKFWDEFSKSEYISCTESQISLVDLWKRYVLPILGSMEFINQAIRVEFFASQVPYVTAIGGGVGVAPIK